MGASVFICLFRVGCGTPIALHKAVIETLFEDNTFLILCFTGFSIFNYLYLILNYQYINYSS